MDSDDGTQAFGELGQSEPEAVHWDTPEWREEMRERYEGPDWFVQYGTIPVIPARNQGVND